MHPRHEESADRIRCALEGGKHDQASIRAALLDVPLVDRDAWFDRAVGTGEIPGDGPELPKGCVPYLPCPVDALLRIADIAPVGREDVFVDVGSGVGRATAFVHLLTGARAIGLEIQPKLVRASRELADRLHLARMSCIEADATKRTDLVAMGTVFFLYCPFSGAHLAAALAGLATIARTRAIRIGCVDLPLPPCDWLEPKTETSGGLAVYRSTFHDVTKARA